eukprot:2375430-Amphidinium_carterae.1
MAIPEVKNSMSRKEWQHMEELLALVDIDFASEALAGDAVHAGLGGTGGVVRDAVHAGSGATQARGSQDSACIS